MNVVLGVHLGVKGLSVVWYTLSHCFLLGRVHLPSTEGQALDLPTTAWRVVASTLVLMWKESVALI